MITYDILLSSLHPDYYKAPAGMVKNNVQWVRGVKARNLSEAAQIACARYPNLGCTPTVMSMGWHVWPQPMERACTS